MEPIKQQPEAQRPTLEAVVWEAARYASQAWPALREPLARVRAIIPISMGSICIADLGHLPKELTDLVPPRLKLRWGLSRGNLMIAFDPRWIGHLLDTAPAQLPGLLMHELMHSVYCHPTRVGRRERMRYNVAADSVINQTLDLAGVEIPDHPKAPEDWYGLSAEKRYDLLPERPEQQPQPSAGSQTERQGEGPGQGAGGQAAREPRTESAPPLPEPKAENRPNADADERPQPATASVPVSEPTSEAEAEDAEEEEEEEKLRYGWLGLKEHHELPPLEMPENPTAFRADQAIRATVESRFTEAIKQTVFCTGIEDPSARTYARIDRRRKVGNMILPGRRDSYPTPVLALDVSGSMEKALKEVLPVIAAILKQLDRRTEVALHTTEILRTVRLGELLELLGRGGLRAAGGTSLEPVIERYRRRPLIWITDGYTFDFQGGAYSRAARHHGSLCMVVPSLGKRNVANQRRCLRDFATCHPKAQFLRLDGSRFNPHTETPFIGRSAA